MEWLKEKLGFSISSTEAKTEEFTNQEIDPCSGCPQPCETHPTYPVYLAKKINQSKPLHGTVKPYKKHIVLCTGSGISDWEAKIEKVEGSFASTLSSFIKQNDSQINYKVLLTASNEDSKGEINPQDDKMDILVFPDMIRFLSVHKDQLETFVKEFLIENKLEFEGIKSEALEYEHVLLVCTHKKRDKRCGVAGPILVEEFEKVLNENPEKYSKIKILNSSHYGGHKFAGNVIIYPEGTWYGRVIPCHASKIIHDTVEKGEILQPILRGKMSEW